MADFERIHLASGTDYDATFVSKPHNVSVFQGAGAKEAGLSEALRKSEIMPRMNAYQYQKDAEHYYGGGMPNITPEPEGKSYAEIIHERNQFIRPVGEKEEVLDYDDLVAKRFHDKLFKTFALADLSLFKKGKIGLRWRSQKEVEESKGTKICGAIGCGNVEGLKDYELLFNYVEHGENKSTMVKVRVCPFCAPKLNYKRMKEKEREHHRRKRRHHRKRKRREQDDEQEEEGEVIRKSMMNPIDNTKNNKPNIPLDDRRDSAYEKKRSKRM
eukprot:TRINITY_DN778398_c0_g1_i1.p1 TRINITY_DN778398_c0_g1~~TRINITY_DN778398_c0_g1_i1.p1  ORF type:complete len:271 (-),score=76.13 TRINITY_DN778398_c0_g1_i1:576-1388(-)